MMLIVWPALTYAAAPFRAGIVDGEDIFGEELGRQCSESFLYLESGCLIGMKFRVVNRGALGGTITGTIS